MNNERKLSTHLKKTIHALTILVCFGGLTSLCLGNDGTDLTINGSSQLLGIGAYLYNANSKDGDVVSCDWSVTDFEKDDPTFTGTLAEVENRGNDGYLIFHSFGSVTLNCNATVDVKGSTKYPSASLRIQCGPLPNSTQPKLNIVGEDYVSHYSEHEYIAEYSACGVPQITWTYPGITLPNENDVTLTFNNLGTFRLDCVLRCTDEQGNNLDPVSNYKDIHVLPPVVLTALRANYENPNVANIPGEEIVKIHYNIDDDDESYDLNKKYKGADCLQTAFKTGNENPDDDLCKLEISFGPDLNIYTLTEGTVYIEVTKGLRLWRNNMRTNDNDIILGKDNKPEQIALSFAVPDEKETIRKIIQYGLYVEGSAPGYRYLKIKFADKQLKLPYYCYAVGEPQDQPNPVQRGFYTNDFNLVDCEWCIKEFSNTNSLHSYNCIAYAVDPRREIFDYNTASYATPFQEAFWVMSKDDRLETPGFDSWDENIWHTDPFVYEVAFFLSDWYTLRSEFREKFENQNITPYKRSGLYYILRGYSSAYRALLEDVLRVQPQLMILGKRYTTMATFNRNPATQDYVKKFFTLPDFAASIYNGHTLVECDNEDDEDRIIMYYSEFHAARALSKTFDCRKLGKNADPDWKMAVSKCGEAEERLIHREEQVSDYYGEVDKAYK